MNERFELHVINRGREKYCDHIDDGDNESYDRKDHDIDDNNYKNNTSSKNNNNENNNNDNNSSIIRYGDSNENTTDMVRIFIMMITKKKT